MGSMNSRKPIALRTIEYPICGIGDPNWGDPRDVCMRQLSKHIIYLCRNTPMSAMEIAAKIHVAKPYVEEELEILTRGKNGQYGLLRRMEDGRYLINFVLFDRPQVKMANKIYAEHLAVVCDTIEQFVKEHEKEYLAFPYRNKRSDINLILWQQIEVMADALSDNVERILAARHFADVEEVERPFSVFGSFNDEMGYASGHDGIRAENMCGYEKIELDNIYNKYINRHFDCGWNVARDPLLQLAMRAVDGIDMTSWSAEDKKHVEEAVACGYLYKERNRIYTKILVADIADSDRMFDISRQLEEGVFEEEAAFVAEQMAALLKDTLLEFLIPEWRLANKMASLSMLGAIINELVGRGVLVPPQNGIGAEGCWMCVEKGGASR